ncbi:MAG: type II toxin-antitoxin system RelE/ParE family toxin [Myxococcaceae bacterium]
MNENDKPLEWVGGAKADLMEFPLEVRRTVGRALRFAQKGSSDESSVKPLKGFGGAGVLEVVESFQKNAYRCVYTVRLASAIYVLHCFQKKSHSGRKTDKGDIELVRSRLKTAQEIEKQKEERAKREKGKQP